ncbi:MAG: ribbon-helix-helix domain-containing protein [Cyanobacteria bacterium]|nr:ribbon-helix-helix domain-containing protein [Cyanobacteriota bacterium]
MRTTLDIEDDVLTAAKELARRQGVSAGQVVSKLLRSALTGGVSAQRTGAAVVAGFRPFAASDQHLVSNEQIDQLRDLEGI